jgi:ABC-type dipeptide/oligopeptide/nickel transport system permease component
LINYVLRRLMIAVPSLLGISIILFTVLALAPGDPFEDLANNPSVPPEVRMALRVQFGLDDPIWQRYLLWLKNMLHGDWGFSFVSRVDVDKLIWQRMPVTIAVIGMSQLLALLVALPVGVLSAVKPYSWFDRIASSLAFIGFSLPTFFTGVLFILFFSIYLGWFPFVYRSDLSETGWRWWWQQFRQSIMPITVLGLFQAASWMRYVRSSVLDVVRLDYVTTARSKGLSERVVINKHVVRNALIPVVTLVALQMPAVFGGAIVTEQIFRIPGIGSLLIDAILRNDTPVIMAVTFVFSCLVIFFNLVADLLYGLIPASVTDNGTAPTPAPTPAPSGARKPVSVSPWAEAWRRFKRHRMAYFSLWVLGLLVLAVLVGPLFYKVGINDIDFKARLADPSAAHLMGTDDLGRDLLARVLYGGRISLAVGLAAMLMAVTVGVLIGALAGISRGWVDTVLMWLTDLFLSLPQLPLLLLLIFLFRDPLKKLLGLELGIFVLIVVVIGGFRWMPTARLVRAQFFSLREKEFVEAARALGASVPRQVWRHILPNSLGPVIVAASIDVAAAIIAESTLSFLGLGFPPDIPTWGRILYDSRDYMDVAVHWAMFPGVAIFLTVLTINFIGDGLRDALDPRRVL